MLRKLNCNDVFFELFDSYLGRIIFNLAIEELFVLVL